MVYLKKLLDLFFFDIIFEFIFSFPLSFIHWLTSFSWGDDIFISSCFHSNETTTDIDELFIAEFLENTYCNDRTLARSAHYVDVLVAGE